MFYPPLTPEGPSAKQARHDIDRLLLITEALWTLIKQHNGYSDEILVRMIQDIDQRKSAATGGAAAQGTPITCPACGRSNTADRLFCMYCGKALPVKPFGS